MAKFKSGDLKLKTGQKVYMGSSDQGKMEFDGSSIVLESNSLELNGAVTFTENSIEDIPGDEDNEELVRNMKPK